MKKNLLSLFFLVSLLPQMGSAENYASLWKKVADAQQNDLPKTQITVLRSIISKATAAGDYGHLIKAELAVAAAETGISPDSLKKNVALLEQKQQQAEGKKQVLADVYASVLGRIYKEHSILGDHTQKTSMEFYKKSMRHPDLLAARLAKDYEPLIIKGYDSNIFYDDLLHVVGLEAEAYKTLHDYYKQHGNRAAACICAYLTTQADRHDDVAIVRKSRYLQTLDSLLREYGDLPMAGEIAIERYNFMDQAIDTSVDDKIQYINYALSRWGTWPRMNILRNAQTRMTLPNFLVDLGEGVQRPQRSRKVILRSITNVQSITMTVTRLNYPAFAVLNPGNSKQLSELRKHLQNETQKTVTHRYIGLPAYKVTSDTMTIEPLPVGVYLVEFTTENSNIAPERVLLHVSDMYAVHEVLPGKQIRLAAVSATTGQPIPGAHIRLTTTGSYGQKHDVRQLVCNNKGEVVYTYANRMPDLIFVYTPNDRYCPQSRFNGHFNYYQYSNTNREGCLMTDRKIYRPGQTVHVAGIFYHNINHQQTKAAAAQAVKFTLHDANGKEVASRELLTDSTGSAATQFVLPSTGLTGQFSIRSDWSRTRTYISVEQYKRPSFEVVFDKVNTEYKSGDTVTVKGNVKTYAGVPIQGARVKYTIIRRPAYWWWARLNEQTQTIATDTILTTDEGGFAIRVPMELPNTTNNNRPCYYNYRIEAQVTDMSGESHRAETRLPLSNRTTLFSSDLPALVLADSLPNITFSYRNIKGEPIPGKVYFKIDDQPLSGNANTPVSHTGLSHLKSGRHLLAAICGEDTLHQEFVVFSIKDKKPAVPTNDWFYQSAETFPTDGKPVYVQVGSSAPDLHIFYTLISGEKVLDSGVIKQSGELHTQALRYQKAWGDGVLLTYTWVKEGICYAHQAEIRKPLPDKRLLLEWKTFRDRLTPGQKERWTLTVKHPNGTPANAQLTATLYDKSLDRLNKHRWQFSPTLFSNLPGTRWYGLDINSNSVYGEAPMRPLPEKELDFSHFDSSVFDLQSPYIYGMNGNGVMMLSRAGVTTDKVNIRGSKMLRKDKVSYSMAGEAVAGPQTIEADDPAESPQPISMDRLRENLSETAFFYPALSTDKNGLVHISFTLPESTTTWRFMGMAHDADLRHGLIEAEAVAGKTVMIQPNMPRFIRKGDQGEINARLSNTSNKEVKGKAALQLIDPETDKVVMQQTRDFTLAAGKTANVNFTVIPAQFAQNLNGNTSLLICRTIAEGRGFSDGEQHYLAVMPETEMVTSTFAFSQHGAGTHCVDLSKLAPAGTDVKLTVEYTNNPQWLMIQALPTVADTRDNDAMSLTAAYYANTLAAHLLKADAHIKQAVMQWRKTGDETLTGRLQKNRELKTMSLDDTPWLTEARNETEQQQLLADFFDESQLNQRLDYTIGKLKQLQNADGSWSWWPGMHGNRFVTAEVCKMLARLYHITGDKAAQQLLKKAVSYLDSKLQEEYDEMLEARKRNHAAVEVPGQTTLETLYIKSLVPQLGKQGGAAQEHMLKLIAANTTDYTLYGKANTAVILARFGYTKQAETKLKSLNEYSVCTEEMGRYYDTRKAAYSWSDYKIPTEVAAIEALQLLHPADSLTIAQMQRWLLQCKRTQAWDTPINSVNAIYAFAMGMGRKSVVEAFTTNTPDATLSIDGKVLTAPASTAVGYVKTTIEGRNFGTFKAVKPAGGTGWGAVYAWFMQASDAIRAQSSGIHVKREIIAPNGSLKTGDKVKVRITITADRDYDFVQVQDKRAACLEPLEALSGYRDGYYCTPKDNATNYYFDNMAKGTHIVETEYYADRAGNYRQGICTVQCAYAPEYAARAAAQTLYIK